MNSEYNMAIALLQFRAAYENLVRAGKDLPDLDLSDGYPFYLLDYEEIKPAVLQWCSIHAARLMKQLPERVDNPACLQCGFYRAGLLPSGLCRGAETMHCSNYPVIVYSKEMVIPYLVSVGVAIDKLDNDSIHLLYMRKADEVYEKKCEVNDDSNNSNTNNIL